MNAGGSFTFIREPVHRGAARDAARKGSAVITWSTRRAKGSIPGGRLAAAEQLGPPDVPGGEVGERATALDSNSTRFTRRGAGGRVGGSGCAP